MQALLPEGYTFHQFNLTLRLYACDSNCSTVLITTFRSAQERNDSFFFACRAPTYCVLRTAETPLNTACLYEGFTLDSRIEDCIFKNSMKTKHAYNIKTIMFTVCKKLKLKKYNNTYNSFVFGTRWESKLGHIIDLWPQVWPLINTSAQVVLMLLTI